MVRYAPDFRRAPAKAHSSGFMISFQSEEHRQKWVATSVHQEVWPAIENTLKSKDYTILLYEVS